MLFNIQRMTEAVMMDRDFAKKIVDLQEQADHHEAAYNRLKGRPGQRKAARMHRVKLLNTERQMDKLLTRKFQEAGIL